MKEVGTVCEESDLIYTYDECLYALQTLLEIPVRIAYNGSNTAYPSGCSYRPEIVACDNDYCNLALDDGCFNTLQEKTYSNYPSKDMQPVCKDTNGDILISEIFSRK